MTDYKVDSNFDIILPLQKLIDENDILFQQVNLLLHTWQNDFVYNTNSGMPYEQQILGTKAVDATDLEVIYYKKISKLAFFKTLNNFQITTTPKRELIISFDVISLNGASKNFTQAV